jgi:hypothetical protein
MESKMVEPLLKQQLEVLENELSNLHTQLHSQGTSNMKDLSLITVIPKWSGTDTAICVHDFLTLLNRLPRLETGVLLTKADLTL